MTLVILEGVNGVGKSWYAAELARLTGSTTFRAFRPNSDLHFDGKSEIEQRLRRAEVPVNTHVEDFYAADFIGQLDPYSNLNLVLDRSLPSALAYGERRLIDIPETMSLWQSLLAPVKRLVYVWLHAPEDVCSERVARRQDSKIIWNSYKDLDASFSFSYSCVARTRMRIDTSKTTLDEGVAKIRMTLDQF